MPLRISPDKSQPSVTIEIPLEKALPDYDLHQIEQPTPHDIDALLVSQGFRDLVDDARGVLTELVAHPPPLPNSSLLVDLDLTQIPHFEIVQLTGAICPGDDGHTSRGCGSSCGTSWRRRKRAWEKSRSNMYA